MNKGVVKKMDMNKRCEPAVTGVYPLSAICASKKNESSDDKVVPVMSAKISAGEPTETTSEIENYANFPFSLFSRIDDSYIVQVQGSSMIGANIEDGDLLLVDSSLIPENGSIVVVQINGEKTVKRLVKKEAKVLLVPENPKYNPIDVTSEDELDIFGVVTRIIKEPI